jgi:hypothetical protein
MQDTGDLKNNACGHHARQQPLLSPIRTITVGPGITPDLLTPRRKRRKRSRASIPAIDSRGVWFTAGGDFHPALRISVITIAPMFSQGNSRFWLSFVAFQHKLIRAAAGLSDSSAECFPRVYPMPNSDYTTVKRLLSKQGNDHD